LRLLAVAFLALAAVVTAPVGAAPAPLDVTMPGKLFSPGELDVLTGQTVTWRNSDASTHTVTADDDSVDSGFLPPGASFSRAFPKTGVYPYHCTIHRFMRGVVRVYALILTGPERPLPPGWLVTLRGVSPVPDSDVVLERLGSGPPLAVARTKAGPDGEFQFMLRPSGPYSYRARAATAASPTLRVPVRPSVAATLTGSSVSITASPHRPGSSVVLQAYDRDRFTWVTVARGKLDASSRARLTFAGKGPAHLRVVVRGRQGWSDGTSRTLFVRASPAAHATASR
jgi:plastocyanin